MAKGSFTCGKCGKEIRPTRAASGQMVCPACFAPLATSASPMPLPRPQPSTARPSGPRSASARRGPAPASHRPATPGEALSLSSGSWLPSPDPGPSPDAITSRTMPNRLDQLPPAPVAAPSGSWMRPPRVYYLGAGGVGLVGVLLVTIFVLMQKAPKAPSTDTASSPENTVAVTPQPAAVHPAAPSKVPEAAPTGPRIIDLMPLIDPARDGITGQWKIDADGLTCDNSQKAKLGIPCNVPEEYDFRIEYTRKSVEENVSQIFSLHKHRCMWIMNGWKGTASGFQLFKNKPANANSTTVMNLPFHVGERHVSVLKVRKNSVEAWVDGRRVSAMTTDGSDLRLDPSWDLPDYSLGVASHQGVTVFHKIELIEGAID